MSKVSKFTKVDKNILVEYIYDDENNISEGYDVLVNTKDRKQSYLAVDTSGTNNTKGNSLFKLDNLSNKYGKIDTSYYTFLSIRNYSTGQPLRHDTLRIHLPINWTFGEYLGFNVRVFAYDTLNQQTYDLSNFYFDMTDVSQSYLLNFTSPPLLFQEKLWGKNLNIEIPSLSAVASQRVNNRPKENSVNANLTSGAGLSLTIPIFIDFQFITNIQTINSISTYILGPKVSISIPQSPEFENLGLMVEHSVNGDFFEIYGMYNKTLAGFNQFIIDSYNSGNRYYVQYSITTYEQNVRGKTVTAIVTENFNETIEFRPIIKYSTTTAIIDVEMRLIDAVDDTYIIRRASYGMLQDEVSRYSLNLIKINLANANKPKIYNIKNSIDPSLVGLSNSMGSIKIGSQQRRIPIAPGPTPPPTASTILNNDPNNPYSSTNILPTGSSIAQDNNLASNQLSSLYIPSAVSMDSSSSIETVKVPFPVLVDKFNIMSRSDSAIMGGEKFYSNGQIMIMINPFDNIFKFSIASGSPTAPKFFDLSGFSEIKFVIKNDNTLVTFPLFTASGDLNLKDGQIVFKITQNKIQDIKKVYSSKVNVFYIVGTSGGSEFVIYSGIFEIFDSLSNVDQLNKSAKNSNNGSNASGNGIGSNSSGPNGDGSSNPPMDNKSINLDPTVKSDVNDLSKNPLSQGTEPTRIPTDNKDMIDKLNQNKL
jgi:hypothetical protein